MIQYAPFCVKQSDYIAKCFSNWLNVAEGGKRAGKNVINLIAWASIIEHHADKLHLASGVSVASAKLNIIDSNGFGIKWIFKGRCKEGKYQERDALYVYTVTGEKVILISGGGKDGDEKYIKGNTYGTAYVTEVNECAKPFVKEVFDRTISSQDRKIFWDLNPKNPAHWFYDEILDVHMENAARIKNYGMNYEHFTLFDNLSLNDIKLRSVLITYDKGSLWYKRDILGNRVAPDGVIYDMFNDSCIVDNLPELINPHSWYTATDYGTTNPRVFLKIVKYEGVSYVAAEDWWDSAVERKQKTDSEYVEDYKEFTSDRKYAANIVDPSAESYIVALRRAGIGSRDADNSVLDGIRLVSDLLRYGKLKVHRSCKNLIKEFGAYIWDEKAAERGEEKPVKQNDHGMDALRYYCKTIVKVVRV